MPASGSADQRTSGPSGTGHAFSPDDTARGLAACGQPTTCRHRPTPATPGDPTGPLHPPIGAHRREMGRRKRRFRARLAAPLPPAASRVVAASRAASREPRRRRTHLLPNGRRTLGTGDRPLGPLGIPRHASTRWHSGTVGTVGRGSPPSLASFAHSGCRTFGRSSLSTADRGPRTLPSSSGLRSPAHPQSNPFSPVVVRRTKRGTEFGRHIDASCGSLLAAHAQAPERESKRAQPYIIHSTWHTSWWLFLLPWRAWRATGTIVTMAYRWHDNSAARPSRTHQRPSL